uniref:Uncharacterized protein n=1 Tax=Rhizophagus irregularis (strain DAOM 181602 / DAOM 197198 / MUCL 43194) TaxID=747089 RepID=U9SSZ5_RHIID
MPNFSAKIIQKYITDELITFLSQSKCKLQNSMKILKILNTNDYELVNYEHMKNVYNDYCYNNSLIINDSSIQKYDQNNFFGIFEINNNSPEENELEIEYLRKPVINYETSDVSMVIHGDHTKNLHKYGAPISSDVAVLMIRDGCDIEPSNYCKLEMVIGYKILYTKIMQNHSNYLKKNQLTLRTEGILNAIHAENSANNIVHHIILPSSFSGES